MPSRFDTIAADDFDRRFGDFKEGIVRRKHGDHTHTETISAVVQLENAAAGAQITAGGLQQQQDRNQIEQAGVVEVAASQEIFSDDKLEINGFVYAIAGLAVGQDAGSKSYVIRRVERVRGRQPNTNNRA